MCYLMVLFLLAGTSPTQTLVVAVNVEIKSNGVSDVIHDCSDFRSKDVTVGIWSVSFPDNLRSLTVENCQNVVLNIATGGQIKRSFQYLTVRNVKNCEIIGSENCKRTSCTSLPSHTTFTNMERMTVNVPLYDEIQFDGGILQFKNVTITSLKAKSIVLVSSSLKKFSITGSTVVMAEREAITFRGSLDSLLEIMDSFFLSVHGNFITCNVTNAIIKKNYFIYAKEESFLLKTRNFSLSENKALEVDDCTFKLFTEDVHMENNFRIYTENNLLRGKICLGLSVENMKRLTVNSSKIYFDGNWNETCPTSNMIHENNTVAIESGKGGKVSSFVARLDNRFFLLWFLALFVLILMFPIAYFLKISIFRIIDGACFFGMKHKRLLNEEG